MSVKVYDGIVDAAATAGNVLTSNGSTAPSMQACSRFLTGSGAPSSGTGYNGDAYYDTAAKNLYLKAANAWSVISALAPGVFTPVSGLIGTTSLATFSAASQTVSWTVPTSVNGQAVSKLVITDVVARLQSGSPGTSATFGLSIAGTMYVNNTRVLPPQGGGLDCSLVNLNTQNISGTYRQASPGDAITVTSGGTFSASSTWLFDIIGYYTNITTSGNASLLQTVSSTGTFTLGASGTTYQVTAATANCTLVAAAANTLVEHEFFADNGCVLTVNAVSSGVIRVGSLGSTATSGNVVLTGPGSLWLVGIAGTNNFTLKTGFSGSVKVN